MEGVEGDLMPSSGKVWDTGVVGVGGGCPRRPEDPAIWASEVSPARVPLAMALLLCCFDRLISCFVFCSFVLFAL